MPTWRKEGIGIAGHSIFTSEARQVEGDGTGAVVREAGFNLEEKVLQYTFLKESLREVTSKDSLQRK